MFIYLQLRLSCEFHYAWNRLKLALTALCSPPIGGSWEQSLLWNSFYLFFCIQIQFLSSFFVVVDNQKKIHFNLYFAHSVGLHTVFISHTSQHYNFYGFFSSPKRLSVFCFISILDMATHTLLSL